MVHSIRQCQNLPILGVMFQSSCRFNVYVKGKLCKANNALYLLRCLRIEQCSQQELDYILNAVILSNLTYGLSVYGSSAAELTTVQCFLDIHLGV